MDLGVKTSVPYMNHFDKQMDINYNKTIVAIIFQLQGDRMDIDYFREFTVLAETGNYLAAADKLYLTQSTLTRHIQAFEKDLGAPVFDRTTRKIALTEYGELMLPYAQQIMKLQQDYNTAIYSQQRLEHDNLQIGTIPMMVSYGITDVLVSFRKEYPGISIDLLEGDFNDLLKMLESGKCDFAFMREFEYTSLNLERLPFSNDAMIALIPENHPLAKEKDISVAQLKDIPLLLLPKDTLMYALCVSECKKAGFDPIVTFTSHHANNLLDLVRKGTGVALLMEKPILKYDLSGISIVDIRPAIKTTVDLVYLPKIKMTQIASNFLSFIKSRQETLE